MHNKVLYIRTRMYVCMYVYVCQEDFATVGQMALGEDGQVQGRILI